MITIPLWLLVILPAAGVGVGLAISMLIVRTYRETKNGEDK